MPRRNSSSSAIAIVARTSSRTVLLAKIFLTFVGIENNSLTIIVCQIDAISERDWRAVAISGQALLLKQLSVSTCQTGIDTIVTNDVQNVARKDR